MLLTYVINYLHYAIYIHIFKSNFFIFLYTKLYYKIFNRFDSINNKTFYVIFEYEYFLI